MLYYEDLRVGEVRELGSHQVSRDELVGFARAWDPQPFHVDEEAARETVFGGLTASSCHTYSISALITSRSESKVAAAAMMGEAPGNQLRNEHGGFCSSTCPMSMGSLHLPSSC